MLVQCDALTLRCAKCGEEKGQEEFYKCTHNKRGFKSYCRKCHYEKSNSSPNRKKNANSYYTRRKAANPAVFMWKQAKHRAKWDYNDLEFLISVEDIILPTHCPYFNKEFIPLDKEWGYSLDRIDSSKGYTKDNIRVISYKANRMKNDASVEELILFAKGVLDVHSGGSGPC